MGNLLLCLGLLAVGVMIGYDIGKKECEEMHEEMVNAVLKCHVEVAKKLIKKSDKPDYCKGYAQAVSDITCSFRPVEEGRKENE